MTPKEKAKELVDKYRTMFYGKYSLPPKKKAKQYALIAVDEMLEEIFDMVILTGSTYVNKLLDYYEEVKQEIEKL